MGHLDGIRQNKEWWQDIQRVEEEIRGSISIMETIRRERDGQTELDQYEENGDITMRRLQMVHESTRKDLYK